LRTMAYCFPILFAFVLVQANTDLQTQFEDFTTRFGKTYSSDERIARFHNFQHSARRINALNANHNGAIFGITKFSDMSPEEFRAKVVTFRTSSIHSPVSLNEPDIPPSKPIDWTARGKVTPVKNQGQCGSGVVDAVIETVESANLVIGKPMTLASAGELVACALNNSGCNGGSGNPGDLFSWVLQEGGLEEAGCFGGNPNVCNLGNCPNPDPNLILKSTTRLPQGETAIYKALLLAPLFICVDAEQWQYYTGGILAASQCGRSINHCAQLTGYSPSQGVIGLFVIPGERVGVIMVTFTFNLAKMLVGLLVLLS